MKIRIRDDCSSVDYLVYLQHEPRGPVEVFRVRKDGLAQAPRGLVTHSADFPFAFWTGEGFGIERRTGPADRRSDSTYHQDVVGRRGFNRGRRSGD